MFFILFIAHCVMTTLGSSYEFVKYLRQYVENSMGTVVDEEIKNLTRVEGQHAVGAGHDTLIHTVTRGTSDSVE